MHSAFSVLRPCVCVCACVRVCVCVGVCLCVRVCVCVWILETKKSRWVRGCAHNDRSLAACLVARFARVCSWNVYNEMENGRVCSCTALDGSSGFSEMSRCCSCSQRLVCSTSTVEIAFPFKLRSEGGGTEREREREREVERERERVCVLCVLFVARVVDHFCFPFLESPPPCSLQDRCFPRLLSLVSAISLPFLLHPVSTHAHVHSY